MPLDTTGEPGTKRMESLADLGVENPNPSNLSMDAVAADWGTGENRKALELDDVGINELAVIYKMQFYNGDWPSSDELNFSGNQIEADQTLYAGDWGGNINIGGGSGFEQRLDNYDFIDGVSWTIYHDGATGADTWSPERSLVSRHRDGYVYLHDQMTAAVDWSTGANATADGHEWWWRVFYDTIEVRDDLLLELLRQD